jgi:hypothetical protein
MPLGLLAPLVLAGLALVLGPVAIHMLRRARTRPLEFPSLRFLRETPIFARALAAPDRLLLLALRIAFVALVVFAFARPVWLGTAEPGQAVAVLLDASASMRRPEARDAALAEARRALEALGAADRVRVGAFDTSLTWLSEAGDRASAEAALARYEPGYGRASAREPLAEAGRWLAAQPSSGRRLVVVSDLQVSNGPWPAAGVDSSVGVEVRQVPNTFETRFVAAARVETTGAAPRVLAGLVTASPDVRRVEDVAADLAGGGASGLRVEPADGGLRLAVTGADGFDADDARYVVMPPAGDVAVLDPGGARPYLAAATSAVDVADAAAPSALGSASRALVSQRAVDSPNALEALDAWVRAGGQAVVFAAGAAEWRFPAVTPEASPTGGLVRIGARDGDDELDRALAGAQVEAARTVAPAPDDRILLRAADGRVLAVRRAYGSGAVTVVGFDPEPRSAPVVHSAVFPSLVAWLLDPDAPHEAEVGDRVGGAPTVEPGIVASPVGPVAVNVPLVESEPAMSAGGASLVREAADAGPRAGALEAAEARQQLWRFLLVAAALVALVELSVALRARRAHG